MDTDVNRLGSAELKQKLETVNGQLKEKRQNLQTLRDTSTPHENKSVQSFCKLIPISLKKIQLLTPRVVFFPLRQPEVQLVEKMTKNCQVFKEEIAIVHLNRQAAHLQNALQEILAKVRQIKIGTFQRAFASEQKSG